MSVVDFGTMNPNATLKEVIEELAYVKDLLNFVLGGNLDIKNIRANSITADRLKANTITAREIAADSITADKMDVSELSAITANMGTLTAGIIYGAYIATANGTYPRIEFSSLGNLLSAFTDATHSINIIPSIAGNPAFNFSSPAGQSYLSKGSGSFSMVSDVGLSLIAPGDIIIDSSGRTEVSANTFVDINAPSGLRVNGTVGLAGTKVYYVSNTSGGATTRKLTFTNGLLTSET